jgi:toxin FitB
MYVLDTDVLSLTNTATGFDTAAVAAWRSWVEDNSRHLFLSVVTLMEVRFGIEKAQAKGATKKADALRKWLAAAESAHRSRIIPVSVDIAHKAGALLWAAVASGVAPSSEDALVAATGAVQGFTVISRNGKHMRALNAVCLDPLADVLPRA